MTFSSSNTDWIWAAKEGTPIKSDDAAETIMIHDDMDSFVCDLSKARGGRSVTPFATQDATATSSAAGSVQTDSQTDANGGSSQQQSSGSKSSAMSATRERKHRALIAHGSLMALAMVIFYPLGAVIIRLLS